MSPRNNTPASSEHSDPGGDVAKLAPLVYDKLRELARIYIRREGRVHTLQPTALVHEAYVRLAKSGAVSCEGKTHFFALAARQMRRVLIDHARAANARKRYAEIRRVSLNEGLLAIQERTFDLLLLDEALDRLSRSSARQGQVAEMRLFAGLSVTDTASELGVSEKTVKRDWSMARAWLSRELCRSRGDIPFR